MPFFGEGSATCGGSDERVEPTKIKATLSHTTSTTVASNMHSNNNHHQVIDKRQEVVVVAAFGPPQSNFLGKVFAQLVFHLRCSHGEAKANKRRRKEESF